MAPRSSHPLRVVTYNILLGGRFREPRIAQLLAECDADVLAIQEVTDPGLVRRLGRSLGMRVVVGAPSDPGSGLHTAIITRLPVRRWRNHRHPDVMLRSHLEAEVETGRSDLPLVRLHCLHLAARFGERANGEIRRMRELAVTLGDIHRLSPVPHLVVGDFNAVAPGDQVAASRFFQRIAELRREGLFERGPDGLWGPVVRGAEVSAEDAAWRAAGIHPHLDVGVPRLPGVVFPLTRRLPRGAAMDRMLNRYIARTSVQHMLDSGYTDCYRTLHPRAAGYTCATWMPAARIDYIFASEAIAPRLARCEVVGSRGAPQPLAHTASDHFPLMADFSL